MARTWADHVTKHGPLVQLADDLWHVTGFGSPLDRNMVVWRRPTGGLWLHSVVALDDAGMAAIDALGPVEVIVVPNGYHRMDCGVYAARYPTAQVVAPAAARDAVEKVTHVHATCEGTGDGLGITVHTPDGTRPYELAYELPLAGGGRALVVADLLFNLRTRPPGFNGFVLRWITDSLGPLHISRVFRLLVLKERAPYAAWLARMAEIPDLRVLCVAHGEPVTSDVAGELRAAVARIVG